MKYALPVLAALMLGTTTATVAHAAQPPLKANSGSPTVRPSAAATPPATLSANFDMALSFNPDVTDWINRSDIGDCVPGDGASYVCSLNGSWSDFGAPLTGTVTDPATGATGALNATCSIAGYSFVAFSVAPPETNSQIPVVNLTDAGGDVHVDCAWRLRMNDAAGSMLMGRASAAGPMTAADPATALVQLRDNVNFEVVAGTGAFAGLTGNGFTTAAVTFPMLGPTGELPVDFQLVSLGGRAHASAVTQTRNTGQAAFQLHGGAALLRISAPWATDRKHIGRALVGVTEPGAKCVFTARSGSHSVKFAALKADKTGSVRLPARKAATLTPGAWRISGECHTGHGVARDAVRVKIAT